MLASVYRTVAGRDDVPTDAELEATVARARAAWPRLDVDAETFVRHLAARAAAAPLDKLHTDDLYLACACGAGDPAALAAFDDACLAPLRGPLVSAGATDSVVADIQQLLRARLLVPIDGRRGIEQFTGRGDIRGWVRVAGVREVIRARRKTKREVQVDDDDLVDRLIARDDPELARLRDQCIGELREVFRSTMTAMSPRERTLLRLHLLDGLSIDAIGELHDVHRSTAARWLVKAEQRLQTDVRTALKDRLSVTTVELAHLWGAIESRLEVNIESLLQSVK